MLIFAACLAPVLGVLSRFLSDFFTLFSLVLSPLLFLTGVWGPRRVFPWLPFLGAELEELYPVIRYKIGVALTVPLPDQTIYLLTTNLNTNLNTEAPACLLYT